MPFDATLDTYFRPVPLAPGQAHRLGSLPELRAVPVDHVKGKPCYGFFLGEDVYWSGDTQDLPPERGPTGKPLRLIFQDCQLDDARVSVHVTLASLQGMPDEVRARTWLMHYGAGFEQVDAKALGFAGFVQAGQAFEI